MICRSAIAPCLGAYEAPAASCGDQCQSWHRCQPALGVMVNVGLRSYLWQQKTLDQQVQREVGGSYSRAG